MYSEGLTVGDVVSHLGVSRPLADLRFRQVCGKSIGRTIAESRAREIKSRLAHFFRRETGMTMSDYRGRCGRA